MWRKVEGRALCNGLMVLQNCITYMCQLLGIGLVGPLNKITEYYLEIMEFDNP